MELRDTSLGLIYTTTLQPFLAGAAGNYVVHAFCTEGRAVVHYNEQSFPFCKGQAFIIHISQLLERVEASDDFSVLVLAITQAGLEQCRPQSNYGTRGTLFLFQNPVMDLLPAESDLCLDDFLHIRERLLRASVPFYRESLCNVIETLFLDFFAFHTRLHPTDEDVPQAASRIVSGFISLLSEGHYRAHRDIGFYADRLCVTPKHLSDTCKRLSGFSASFWIDRFIVIELVRLLRDPSLSLAQITDRLHFSSAAHFNRFVHRHLGTTPSALRP